MSEKVKPPTADEMAKGARHMLDEATCIEQIREASVTFAASGIVAAIDRLTKAIERSRPDA